MDENQSAISKPKACIIGYPAKHSLSPILHRYWINQYRLNADYRVEEVESENIFEFINNLSKKGYIGANVTMPHKDIAFQISRPDAHAIAVRASNTLWFENNILRSTNTDTEGFLNAIDAVFPNWDHHVKEAIVLGAGGAARAIIYGLVERGITRINVVNRTLHKATDLRVRFGCSVIPHSWDALPNLIESAKLLVNATSLGMQGKKPLDIDTKLLSDDSIVCDIVYSPLNTTLLADAKARNLVVLNGLDMLLNQAVRGFELWFGIRPKITQELYETLVAHIVNAEMADNYYRPI